MGLAVVAAAAVDDLVSFSLMWFGCLPAAVAVADAAWSGCSTGAAAAATC